jgi:hypothetical protein
MKIKNFHYHKLGETCSAVEIGHACIERERMKKG